ncbi:hypothetical protein, partial [Sandarakinorhabdus sp.]|uniref:hypothetical protein n=1 Tax=Sandarakinorhabdus sp. TaxID=1916663 RepID=UPI00286E2371
MRMILCFLLSLIAVVFAVVGTTMPLTLHAQAATDRVYYEQFQVAASYIDKNGKIPTREALRSFESSRRRR